eukprot:Skav204140  [mRNA]  locus=scaffold903:27572:28035:+ [translate_table: standard]
MRFRRVVLVQIPGEVRRVLVQRPREFRKVLVQMLCAIPKSSDFSQTAKHCLLWGLQPRVVPVRSGSPSASTFGAKFARRVQVVFRRVLVQYPRRVPVQHPRPVLEGSGAASRLGSVKEMLQFGEIDRC